MLLDTNRIELRSLIVAVYRGVTYLAVLADPTRFERATFAFGEQFPKVAGV